MDAGDFTMAKGPKQIRVSMTLSTTTVEKVESREADKNFSYILERDLIRFFYLCDLSLKHVLRVFSEEELQKISGTFREQDTNLRVVKFSTLRHTMLGVIDDAGLNASVAAKLNKLTNEEFIAMVVYIRVLST
jgi:hypothetical protein